MVLGDLDSYMQKNKTRSPTYAIHENKLKSLRSMNISQKRQVHKMEQKQPLQQMVLGDLDSYVQKNET